MKKKRLVCISILILLVPAVLFSQSLKKHPWGLTDQFDIKRIGNLEISPKNDYVLFTYQSNIWLLPVKGGEPKQITHMRNGAISPKWSPDGQRIAYFTREGEGYALWVMECDGRGQKKLTVFERSNAYLGRTGTTLCWSPCGKYLAYTAAGPRHYTNVPKPTDPPNGNDVMIVDRLLYKSFYYYSDMRRTYVFTISVDGGKPQQISFGDYDYHSISWSPKGDRIACISNQTGRDDYNANNDICLLSPQGKDMIQLTHTIGPEYGPVYSPDGTKLAYPGRTRDHRSKESDAELYKIYVINAQGGSPVNLTAPLDRWSNSPTWSYDSEKVYFTAQNAGRVCLYVAPAEGGKVTPLIEDYGQVQDFVLGKNGEIFYIYSDATHPSELYKTNIHGTRKEKLTSFNKDFTDRIEIIEPEEFTCTSFDGLKIEGWIMKPYGFKEGINYPLVLAVHGGPHGQYGYRLSTFFQYLAANGYAVTYTNPRGSSGYGQDFSDGCVGDLGGGDYKDIMACVDYVIDNYKFVDENNMGVTGGSYGGYMTNWIITQNNRFKAAIPVASISNLISQWGTDANTLWFESDGGFMPFENYEKAWNMSPLKYITNCKTPTLFIHGAWDFCVNLGQAEEMYTALKKLGVDAVLAIYPNEGHGVRQLEHVIDYHRRALNWFDKYLK